VIDVTRYIVWERDGSDETQRTAPLTLESAGGEACFYRKLHPGKQYAVARVGVVPSPQDYS
jgi:hypothetical protein